MCVKGKGPGAVRGGEREHAPRAGASIPAMRPTLRGAARGRRAYLQATLAAAGVAFAPFARGVAAGHVLYFRDLAVLFYPFRQYVAEGLRAGQLRYWDPWVHEGVPLLYPPLAYPVDLLHGFWPDLRWISLLLALHVPLAAVAFAFLARRLGLSPGAAAGGGLIYALGGFVLSTINLYVYVEAAAWAPLVILALRAAATRGARAIALAAVVTAVALSTLGIEVVLQAIVIGLLLALRRRRPTTLARALAALALGAALAAPVILVMRENMAAGERAHGFATDIVLNQSVHPFTLLQVLVAHLYGDLARLPDRWWGSNFFDRGFPYILSLYLGATVLALAVVGAVTDPRRSRRLVIAAVVFLAIALGRWGGLGPLLEALPDSWRIFRYPTKAFFGVHLCVALLAAIGLNALSRGRGWRTLLGCAATLALPLLLAPALPAFVPRHTGWFVSHFFPPAVAEPLRTQYFAEILDDAARGGALALAGVAVAALVLGRRLGAPLASSLVAAIAVTDLLRAGGGLNPMMAPAILRTSPVVTAGLHELPVQRIFTCPPERSPAYWQARGLRPNDHEALTLAAWADTLTPHFNRPAHVQAALSEDLTSLVPLSRLLPRGVGCGTLDTLVPRLRGAGVSHVLSLDPLEGRGLTPAADIAPPRLAPLHVYVYAVENPTPLAFVAARVHRGTAPPGAVPSREGVWIDGAPEDAFGATGTALALRADPDHLAYAVEATRPTALVVLDGFDPGWRTTVDGAAAPMLVAGRHRAVWVPAGRSTVEMRYRPRGLVPGLALWAAATLAVVVLWRKGSLSGGGAGAAEKAAARRTA